MKARPTIRIELLHGLRLVAGGVPVPVGAGKLRTVLAAVACIETAVTRDQLIEELWPGRLPPTSAVNTVQAYVSRLRRLTDHDLIVRGSDGYRLHPDVAVDVPEVRAAVFHAAALDDDQARWDALCLLLPVVRAAEPLIGVIGGSRIAHARERTRDLAETAVEDWARCGLRLGRARDVEPVLDELPAARDQTVEIHMQALVANGHRIRALDRYRGHRDRLARDQGVEPRASLQRLQLAILQTVEHDKPPRDVGRQHETEASVPADRLLGRERLLDRVTQSLGESRLVTLTGPGGVGKSRLAVEVADGHDGPVLWIEVEPDTDVAAALRRELLPQGDTELDLAPVIEELRRAADTLVVFDNAEVHLHEVLRAVDKLLTGTPVRLLITTRQALRTAHEHVIDVAPLDLPTDPDDLAACRTSSAVALFVARSAAHGGAVSATTTGVGALVRHLDGLPLAIELVSALTTVLGPVELLEEIRTHGLPAPPPGNGVSPVDAVLARSWHDLPPPEQELLAALSLTTARTTLRFARALTDHDAVQLLVRLQRRSLIQVDTSRELTTIHLLELVRDFARRQLTDDLRRQSLTRIAAALSTDVAALSSKLRHGSGDEARAGYQRLRHQLLRTVDELLTDDLLPALADVLGSAWFCMLALDSRSPAWEAVEAVSRRRDELDDAARLAIDDAVTALQWIRGDFAGLVGSAAATLASHRSNNDPVGTTHAATFHTYALVFLERPEEAMAGFAVALPAAKTSGDHFFEVALQILAALAADHQGMSEAARAAAAAASTAAARHGDAQLVSWAAWCSGRIHLTAGEILPALREHVAALRLIHGLRHRLGTALALAGVVSALVAADHAPEDAALVLAGALAVPESDPLILRHPLEDLDHLVGALVDRLGPEHYRALRHRGTTTPITDLVELALTRSAEILTIHPATPN